jgi:hypothetical protein
MSLDAEVRWAEKVTELLARMNDLDTLRAEQIAELRDELHQEALARREAIVALANRIESVRRAAGSVPVSLPAVKR